MIATGLERLASFLAVEKNITRRAMLTALPAAVAAVRPKAKPLPNVGEFVRFADPETETFVVRLTSLKSASVLPAAANRFVSLKDRSLLLSSDRTGQMCPYQLDLRTGVIKQLAQCGALATASLCLDPREHSLHFLDGGVLRRVEIGKKGAETVAEGVTSFSFAAQGALFIVRADKLERMDGGVASALESSGARTCVAQPNGLGCLYTREISSVEREFWYAGSQAPVLLAKGSVSDPFWAPDSQSIFFLRDVAMPNVTLAEIHQVTLSALAESKVTPTSQFASFAPNFDASVFVGASRSKAQPNVVLLLRSARREMTLCQHRATRAANVSPVFSPDAKRVYFQSDNEGKAAIYSVNVEALVEPLSESTEG